jgi:hypothetical protein
MCGSQNLAERCRGLKNIFQEEEEEEEDKCEISILCARILL